MTAYVVSGMGQAKDAGYKIDDDRLNKGRAWLQSMLASHPDMIPDLRAYTVYALATTGGAAKDALDKAWDQRSKVSDEGSGANRSGFGRRRRRAGQRSGSRIGEESQDYRRRRILAGKL